MSEESSIRRHARIGPRDRWAQKSANSLYAFLIVGFLGALLFGYLVHQVWPDGLAAGGMVGFIVAVTLRGIWTARRDRGSADEYANGKSRTEEEVRAALAELKARQK
ncbi:hypothetical protein [Tateyamaria sp. SN3-11]|uniref:hypothetical protein n=1 Tax=Tateyamaria sp. SN3-11 TaxID=3092147 RepID=UPI0039EA7025